MADTNISLSPAQTELSVSAVYTVSVFKFCWLKGRIVWCPLRKYRGHQLTQDALDAICDEGHDAIFIEGPGLPRGLEIQLRHGG